ncbi:2-dehydropantoate 2-reductase N-terminal domain-containing protein [Herbiconiux ginsengi]|uniref:Ketopantoate reductase PanE/ApbA C terminal n=1 Tax=Herbiconiux ginsengi TaxID=381665 RepID=A0A1H3T3Q1_9MICO|nr:2-dehydropantoate 2-reductase N-terminal domain-containing protein [Herbiconiux ginsengi]SDZ43989.1 Ketopantoate reductase PanE/ApbA C terminal [Herbiconiux ginsengi]
MRIAVIGAGAVGGVIAALADRAGHAVTVTARGAQLEAVQRSGLHLTGHWGEHTARPRASAVLDERPELAVLTVKAQDARAALEANADFLDGVPLVVVQNGLGGAEAAAAQLPTTPVVGGLALFAASYLSPGEVSITTPAATYLGLPAAVPPLGRGAAPSPAAPFTTPAPSDAAPSTTAPSNAAASTPAAPSDGAASTTPALTSAPAPASASPPASPSVSASAPAPSSASAAADGLPTASAASARSAAEAALRLATATLGAFMPIEVTANFAGAQWTKLIVNQVNALPAITGLSVQETIADPRLRAVLTASMREAVAVARARDVHFETLLGLSDRLLRIFAAAPRPLAQLLPRLMSRRVGSTPNPGSTLQSIRRGQLTEIDHLNGAVMREARAAGVEAPINAHLVRLVHRVEAEGAFITPEEIAISLTLPK